MSGIITESKERSLGRVTNPFLLTLIVLSGSSVLASCEVNSTPAPAMPGGGEGQEGENQAPDGPDSIATEELVEGLNTKPVSLEKETTAASVLEGEFATKFGRQGVGFIFKNSSLGESARGSANPDIQLIFTPAIMAEGGQGSIGTEIYRLLPNGDWIKLTADIEKLVVDEVSDVASQELLDSYKEGLKDLPILLENGLSIEDLTEFYIVSMKDDIGQLVIEIRFVLETDSGQKLIRGYYVFDMDGKFHPVELNDGPSPKYEVAMADLSGVTTDGGPLISMPNVEKRVGSVSIPDELFEMIRDQNPVVGVSGRQILNGETGEVLLEKKDGQGWREVETGVVAEAMSYGMPQEQAEKLEGLSVSFEEVSQYVDGVLVTDQETGADLFYFDYQTEFLVAVDRWPVITDVEKIRDNEMTEEELFSDEYFAWLKYIASTLEFGDDLKYPNKKGVKTGQTVHIIYEGENNFSGSESERAPFKRMVALAYIEIKEDDETAPVTNLVTYGVLPLFEKDEVSGKVAPIIVVFGSTADKFDSYLEKWSNLMNVTSIITTEPSKSSPKWRNRLVEKTYKIFSAEQMRKMFMDFRDGDPSALSGPGIVVSSVVLDSPLLR